MASDYTQEHVTRLTHCPTDEIFEVRAIEGEVGIIYEPDMDEGVVIMVPPDLVEALMEAMGRTRDFILDEWDRVEQEDLGGATPTEADR